MPRVVYDPAATSIIVDLVILSADGTFSAVIPVVLDTGASHTIIANDVLARLGYDPANPLLDRQRIITRSGIEYAPSVSVRSAAAIGQRVSELEVVAHDLPAESGVDGLLGLNFLKHFKLTIHFRRGVIDLTKAKH
jgi:predicted aspartyl protease